MHFNAGRCADALESYRKAAHHAEAAGDIALFMDESSAEATQASFGPTPVAEGLVICEETLERVKGQPALEAWVCESLSRLEAMQGNDEAARAAINRARSVAQELGATHTLASMSLAAADVEWYAGDIAAAEREIRSGYEAFSRSGAMSYRATWAAWLAVSLISLGRDEGEALDLTRESESLAGEDDITAQVPWRGARARILARRGETEDAERIAREAVEIVERTDWLNMQGDAQMALADVLRLAGRGDDATESAGRALERYEQKGNIVAAGWARTLLEDLRAG
jgi:tetratricopeptide (TPR) repeat protein